MWDLIAKLSRYVGKKQIYFLCFIGKKFTRLDRELILRCKLFDVDAIRLSITEEYTDPVLRSEWWYKRDHYDISISDETLIYEIRRGKLAVFDRMLFPHNRYKLISAMFAIAGGSIEFRDCDRPFITYSEYLEVEELPVSAISKYFRTSCILRAAIFIKTGRRIEVDQEVRDAIVNIRDTPGFIEWFTTNPISRDENIFTCFDKLTNPRTEVTIEDILLYYPYSRIYPIVRTATGDLAKKYLEIVSRNYTITRKQMTDLFIMLGKPTNLKGVINFDMFFHELSPESVDHLMNK